MLSQAERHASRPAPSPALLLALPPHLRACCCSAMNSRMRRCSSSGLPQGSSSVCLSCVLAKQLGGVRVVGRVGGRAHRAAKHALDAYTLPLPVPTPTYPTRTHNNSRLQLWVGGVHHHRSHAVAAVVVDQGGGGAWAAQSLLVVLHVLRPGGGWVGGTEGRGRCPARVQREGRVLVWFVGACAHTHTRAAQTQRNATAPRLAQLLQVLVVDVAGE